jgi:hypothetical protein
MKHTDDLISQYLKDLERELSDLPRAARRDVVEEISQHIADERAELTTESEAAVRAVLDRLGDPAEIAAEARERFSVPPRRRRPVEVTALVLLTGGIILPGLGWLAGVTLLWVSDVWNIREKLLGTLFAPAGWVIPAWFVLQTVGAGSACLTSVDQHGRTIERSCSGGTSSFERIFWPTLLIAFGVASVATMIYLAVRLRRLRRPAAFA